MKPLSKRSAILIGATAFCAAVGAAWLIGSAGDSDGRPVVEVASRTERKPGDTAPPASAPLEASARAQSPSAATGETVNIFATKSWVPPPPPPPPSLPTPPQPPQAPPLPFSFMGMMTEESGKRTYYLAQGDRAYAVVDGDKINNVYRVNGLRGQQLSFTYLPMGVAQTLSMPPATGGNVMGGPESASSAYIPSRPARSVYTPEAPAPSPDIAARAQGNPALPGMPVPGAGPPGTSPGAAAQPPAKAPAAAQVPQALSFEPPPTFNMEQSQIPSSGAEPDSGEATAAAQPSENN